jgi:hypothetical protein
VRKVKHVDREQVCLNGIKGSKKGSERENTKIVAENDVGRIFFYAKGIIHHVVVPENRTVLPEPLTDIFFSLIASILGREYLLERRTKPYSWICL